MRLDYVGIGTRQSEGIHPIGLQARHKILVHQSAIDHCHHLQHLSVGDAAAIDHLRLDAQLGSHLSGATAAAMHQHFSAGDGRKVLEQLAELRLIFNDGTAHFHHRKCGAGVLFSLFFHFLVLFIFGGATAEHLTLFAGGDYSR